MHAIDITSSGIDVDAFLSAVVGDPRVWYVIHAGRIWSRTTGWAARAHSRRSRSTTHIHVNLREDSQAAAVAAENDTRSWFRKGGASPAFLASPANPTLFKPPQTRRLQQVTHRPGGTRSPPAPRARTAPTRTAAVASFQRDQGWAGSQADGVAGPETLRRFGRHRRRGTVQRAGSLSRRHEGDSGRHGDQGGFEARGQARRHRPVVGSGRRAAWSMTCRTR